MPARHGLLIAALATASLAGVALAAKPLPGGHYAGTTHQGKTISFDVSPTGKRIIHPIFYLKTRCTPHGKSFAETSTHATAIASTRIHRGRFVLRFAEKQTFGRHLRATAIFTLKGHFTSRKRAKGTASVTVRYSNHDSCASGAVGFTARG